jgi:hypothetical protein
MVVGQLCQQGPAVRSAGAAKHEVVPSAGKVLLLSLKTPVGSPTLGLVFSSDVNNPRPQPYYYSANDPLHVCLYWVMSASAVITSTW